MINLYTKPKRYQHHKYVQIKWWRHCFTFCIWTSILSIGIVIYFFLLLCKTYPSIPSPFASLWEPTAWPIHLVHPHLPIPYLFIFIFSWHRSLQTRTAPSLLITSVLIYSNLPIWLNLYPSIHQFIHLSNYWSMISEAWKITTYDELKIVPREFHTFCEVVPESRFHLSPKWAIRWVNEWMHERKRHGKTTCRTLLCHPLPPTCHRIAIANPNCKDCVLFVINCQTPHIQRLYGRHAARHLSVLIVTCYAGNQPFTLGPEMEKREG